MPHVVLLLVEWESSLCCYIVHFVMYVQCTIHDTVDIRFIPKYMHLFDWYCDEILSYFF